MRRTEAAFVAFVVLAMAGAVAADRFSPPAEGISGEGRPGEEILSTTAYCPALPQSVQGDGTQTLVSTTNLGARPVHLRRSAIARGASSEFKQIDLSPRRRTEIAATEFGAADAAVIVESFGAATSTQELFVSRVGAASSKCSVGPADRWLFATGSTARGRDTHLLVANPFEEEARIRVRVITATEDLTPSILKDLLIPGRSQVAVLMAENFPETDSFGMDVTATRGRVVASRAQTIATRDGFRGLTHVVGARETGTRWLFAGGEVPNGGDELIVLLNPGDRESLVRISFQTVTDQTVPPELQQVAVPAGRQVVVSVAKHLPAGTRHGTLVISTNGVPFVAERQTLGAGGGAAGVMGESRTARRWVASFGPAGAGGALSVTNFGSLRAVVNVVLIRDDTADRPPEIIGVTIDPGRRATIDLTGFLAAKSATALIEAVTGEVAVEARTSLGEPSRDFAEAPADPL